MVLGPSGEVGVAMELQDKIAKKRGGRSIPLHAELREALIEARQLCRGQGPVIQSERGGAMTPMSIVVWFSRAYETPGLEGCSSHSGRRTFITRAARLVHKAGGSLRDVHLLAGHRSIQTAQRYIDSDSDAQRRLVASIPSRWSCAPRHCHAKPDLSALWHSTEREIQLPATSAMRIKKFVKYPCPA
jgi:integrase